MTAAAATPLAMQPDTDRVTDVLSAEEISELTQASDLQGWLSVGTTWLIITGTLALVALIPTWWSIALALVILGGRHLALAILMHDASHHSLFRSKRLNDVAGKWLCAAPAWQNLQGYRVHHLTHHAHTGTEKDNDLNLVEPFPTTRAGLVRKFSRDLLGLTALKRVIGILMMDLELVTYTASAGARRIDQTGRPWYDYLRAFGQNTMPMLITNGLLFAGCWLAGHPEVFALWVIAYMTTFSLFLRIRAIAEHACTEQTGNQFRNTRTTLAGPLARLTVAPHGVNYHLEHHLLMTVPHYHLKRMHQLLRQRGVYEVSPLARNYLDVLRIAHAH